MVEAINKLIRISRQLLQDKGREPLPEEIARRYGHYCRAGCVKFRKSLRASITGTPIGEGKIPI